MVEQYWNDAWLDKNFCINMANISYEVATIGGKIAYVGKKLADVEEELLRLEQVEIPKYKAQWYMDHTGKNEDTGKAYTKEYIDHLRRLDPEDTLLKERRVKLSALRDRMKYRYAALMTQGKLLEVAAYLQNNPQNNISSIK